MRAPTGHESTLPPLPATIHLVGIGGIGVSGLARILAARGYTITGSDLTYSPVFEDLRALGISVNIGHDPANVGDASLVVTTAAAKESNPELQEARSRSIPVIKRARLLGELSADRVCLAVAGSHGKSTTAGMLAHTLTEAGQSPSFAVGAEIPQLGANAGPGEGRHFVVEADEYDYSFLTLSPDIAVITNIEHDHPDLFPDLESVDDAFEQFAGRLEPNGRLVLSSDDPGCRRLITSFKQLSQPPDYVTVGRANYADWRLDDASLPAMLTGPDGSVFRLDLAVPGAHNRMNAAMVLVVCAMLSLDPAPVLRGIRTFSGVGRRFDLRGEAGGVSVFDDYAHHPTEIRATIDAARERYPESRIWAVFQPHTFSRTRQLLHEFASALDGSDRPVLVDIYAARESDDLGVSSQSIADAMEADAPVYRTPQHAAEAVADQVAAGDIVLFLGAGDIWQAASVLIDRIESRTGTHG